MGKPPSTPPKLALLHHIWWKLHNQRWHWPAKFHPQPELWGASYFAVCLKWLWLIRVCQVFHAREVSLLPFSLLVAIFGTRGLPAWGEAVIHLSSEYRPEWSPGEARKWGAITQSVLWRLLFPVAEIVAYFLKWRHAFLVLRAGCFCHPGPPCYTEVF